MNFKWEKPDGGCTLHYRDENKTKRARSWLSFNLIRINQLFTSKCIKTFGNKLE